ncbi:hypothetical protein QUC31_003173 [Theobroma cacao]
MENFHHLEILFPLFIFLLPLQFFSPLLLSSAYTLPEEYFINCGSRSNFTGSGNRNFVGDLNSGFHSLVGRSSPLTDASPSAGVSLLYRSARIFRQPSFYEFVIKKNGTYFVRLHFFVFSSPANLTNARFNVSASGFWLLLNFNVKNSSGSPVIKEFFITINVGSFRIKFIPSEGSHLAFVNAIEVFLAPESFIRDNATRITPAGSRNSFDGLLSQVLQTLYRINVGGLTLTPENDTLWRTWIPDDSFLFNSEAARNSEFFADTPKFQLGGATEYDAPSLVYKTAKELNIDDSRQLNFFNITWSFNVSKNSLYFVRVHFCDIISVSLDAIIFNLYIYNKFREKISPYDQMGQLAAPFYIDFVVDSDESGIMNISIGPRRDSQNQNAFLNGLEIMELMKKSDFDLLPEKPKSKWNSLFAIVGSVGGGAFVIVLIVIVLLSLKCRKAKPEQSSGLPDVELSVDVKGTFGYLDPEYFISLQLTDKSDVYSFGVVLLEVLCARPAVVTSNRREEVNLAEWGMLCMREGQLEKIVDPMLVDKINPNSLRKFAETTEKCLKPSGSERPSMRDVLWDLEYALQLQLTQLNREPLEDSTTNASLEFSMPAIQRLPSHSFPAVDEEDATVVFDDASDVTASEVFSKLRIGDAR